MSLTELIGTAIGCMLMALGFASIAAWGFRRRPAERLLLMFGIWLESVHTTRVADPSHIRGSGHRRGCHYRVDAAA
jgi:hypothetical protein